MMKIILEIPDEFENHYKEDRFEDSLCRLRYDLSCLLNQKYGTHISWKYDLEVLDMLITVFQKNPQIIIEVSN